jgi:hypothetical protein
MCSSDNRAFTEGAYVGPFYRISNLRGRVKAYFRITD